MLSRGAKLRLGVTYWASAAGILGIVGWSTITVVGMQQDLEQAEKDRAALVQQVEDLGGTPVAGPTGKPGTAGRDGRDGDPGAQGPRGADGKNGSPGSAGGDGVDGQDGKDGEDGAVGPEGPQGPKGVDGTDGAPGPQGPQGPQGDPGPACPDGYEPHELKYNGQILIVCKHTPLLEG